MKCARLFMPMLIVASASSAQDPAFPKPDSKEAFVQAHLNRDGDAIVVGLNRFGVELYHSVANERGDLAISPASVSTAFGLAYAGAKGRTADEIGSVLNYPKLTDFHSEFGAVLRTMELRQNGRTLTVNNAIWLQRGMKVRPDYVALVDRNYRAGLERVDYESDPDAARNAINRWVESKTNDRIRNLLTSLDVTPLTRSVLVNTVYFKADWAIPFDQASTKVEGFTTASGRKAPRPLMHRQGDYSYAEEPGLKIIRMPYRGGETEMVVFLPDKAAGLAKLERSLSAPAVDRWMAKLNGSWQEVVVTFPKFRIEKRFQLVPVLRSMGMRTPLSDDSDFSGMKVVLPASADREDWNLKISTIVHQVFVEVEEKGTEAAAATAIGTIIITGSRRVREPKVFQADHPFLFLIRDRRTGAVLFIGRYSGETA